MSIIDRVCNKIRKELYKQRGLKQKKDTQVRWGIIGLGYMANVFAEALEASECARLVAAASRDSSKAALFAKKHHVENAYGSYEEMLEKSKGKIDVIYIATPQKYHYEHIKMCLEQGYGVLCEKPITSNKAQLEELIELARTKKVFLMEGMWMKCLPTYKKAKTWLEEGKIGELQFIQVDLSKEEKNNTNKLTHSSQEGGGVLLDYGIYALSFPLDFMDKEVKIYGFTRKNRENGIDAEWQISLTDEKITADISISSLQEGTRKAILVGTKGKIVFEPQFNRTNTIHLLNLDDEILESFCTKYIFEGFEYEAEEVNRSIEKCCKENECVSLDMSAKALGIVDLLFAG